jgi:PTH1 family peptidyl-tRNA hydrolase
MKYLIAGLGQSRAEYAVPATTSASIALDALAETCEVVFSPDRYADRADSATRGARFILIKPQHLHEPERKGRALLDGPGEGWNPERLLVIADDLALPFGNDAPAGRRRCGGHNGLSSIIELLGTEDFPRLRFGIGKDFARGRQSEYVLGTGTKRNADLPERVDWVGKAILQFGLLGIGQAMNAFNKR